MESAAMEPNNPFSFTIHADISRNAKLQSGSRAIIQIWFAREARMDENIALF